MAQFRRFSRLEAVLAVLFATLTPALAQDVICTALVANQPQFRQEGLAEPAGDVLLECTQNRASSQFAGPQTLSLYVAGATVASRQLYSGTSAPTAIPTEAALLINDCTSSSGTSSTGAACSTSTIPTQGTLQYGALVFSGFTLPLSTGSTFPYNFQLRITNVRVNANPAAAYTFVTGTVLATFPVLNQSGLVLGVVLSSLSVTAPQQSSLNGCAPSQSAVSGLTVTEVFQSAFKSPVSIAANSIAGGWYQNTTNTESQTILSPTLSGWTNQLAGILPGQADHPTRIRVNLSGIPAGVTVLLPTNLTSLSGNGTLAATSGGDLGAFAAVTGSQIPITSSGSVTYEVRSQSPQAIDSFPFALTVSSAGNVGPGPILESVTYAPTTLENSIAIPVFADTSVPTPIAAFSSCLQSSHLTFTQQPFRGPILSAISPVVVQVQDGNGNLISSSSAAVTVTSSPSGVSQTVNAVNGIATFSNLIFNTSGTYALSASAGGIGSATSGAILIAGQTTTTTFASSANPQTYGQAITLTAIVSPSNATGSVTFYDGVAILGTRPLASGRAILSTSLLASGYRSLTALYSGDATYAPGKSASLAQTISPVSAGSFASPTYHVAGGTPAVADLNGDGKADLIAGVYSTMTVLLGNGDGSFGSPIYTATTGVYSDTLAVGDFNGDGRTDVVVLNGGNSSVAGGNTMSVLLGNGDGTFQTAINTSLGNNPISVLVGDFNGDGKADVAVGVTNQVTYSLNVFLGNGDGTFQAPVSYALGSVLNAAALGDFNGDGIPDIIAATTTGISVLLGNGDGSFQSPLNQTVGSGASSIAVGDFNADSKADIVIGNCCASGTGITVLMGSGNGTFQAAGGYSTPGPTSVTTADINGDGNLDIVAVAAGSLSAFLGNGNGTFQAAVNYTGGLYSGTPWVADFNGDGRADIAVSSAGEVAVFLGTTPAAPTLNIAKSHIGNFTQGQTNAVYTVTVSSAAATGSTMRTSVLQSTAPTLISVSPYSAPVNSDVSLTITGTGFTVGAVLTFGTVCTVSTAFLGSTELNATLPGSCLSTAGNYNVTVAGSNALVFTVDATSGGSVTLTSVSPSTLTAGIASELVLVGTNFTPSTVVYFNGNTLLPTYINSSELYVSVPAPDVITGTLAVYVSDPLNGNSGVLEVPVTAGSSGGPTLISISPTFAPLNYSSLTLILNGTGFGAGNLLTFGNVCTEATTFISSTELVANLPAICLTTPGNLNVTVGGSNSVVFTVGTPATGIITLNSVVPSTLTAGVAATLQLSGTNFTPSTVVYFNGNFISATYLSSTYLYVASVPAALVTTGSLPVYVRDPTNGISATLYVTVAGPTVTVTETIPTGMTLVSMSGTGWACPSGGNTCTRSDPLAAGASYPAIIVTVNVAANSPASLTNQVSVTSGGSAPAIASDPTTILQLPSAPVLTAPANAASGIALNPTLTWTASNGATSYDVYFGPASSPPFAANVSSTNYTPAALSPGTTYHWQVVAKNSAGNAASAVWSFTTASLPAIAKAFNPTSIQPGGTSLVTVTLANGNASTLTGGAFTDTLVNMSAAGGVVGGTCAGTTPSSLTAGQTALAFNGIAIPASSTCTVTFSVTSSALGTLTNIASGVTTAQTPTAGAASNTATLTVSNSTAALRFVPVLPCRVVDTRLASGSFGGPSLYGSSRTFPIPSGSCGIPSTAAAYALNVTVVPDGPLGYLTIWPTGQPQPTVSTLNSLDGRIKANAAIVPAGTGGAISVYASAGTDVVLDINGYFTADTSQLAFYPVTPCRVVDTRNAAGTLGGPAMASAQTRSFPVTSSSCNIPSTAQAYSLNFTVVPPAALGYLTAWPTGGTQQVVSTLNAPTGAITANAAIVPAGTGGAISVYASATTHVVIDINGYFAPNTGPGLSFYAAAPCRVVDTRLATGSLGGPSLAGERDFPLTTGPCGLPSTAQAYSLNATVVPQATLGYLTLWPMGQAQPVVSTLNSPDGSIVANGAIVPAGSGGSISAYASYTTDLILDANGYFGP